MNCYTALDWAKFYVNKGWQVVPIPHKTKFPRLMGWEQLRLVVNELPIHFRAGAHQNVGVLLGVPSKMLVDVDLDDPVAVQLASKYLPPTLAVFGRVGKPRSHWIYYLKAESPTKQWRLSNRKVVAELRSTGAQTVFPGSTHPSGELIHWETFGEPATVEPAALIDCLESLYLEVADRSHSPDESAETHLPERCEQAPPIIVNRARRYLAKLSPAVSGQGGHDATFHAACSLVLGFGLDRPQSLVLLQEWNNRCVPPWNDRELEHKIDDALKQPGWRGYLLSSSATLPISSAIERANRHAIEHRLKQRRRAMS